MYLSNFFGNSQKTEQKTEQNSDSELFKIVIPNAGSFKKAIKTVLAASSLKNNLLRICSAFNDEDNIHNKGFVQILLQGNNLPIHLNFNMNESDLKYFKCDEKELIYLIDTHKLDMYLKTIRDNDDIILSVNKNKKDFLRIQSTYSDTSILVTQGLDNEKKIIKFPEINFDARISIDSHIYKDMTENLPTARTEVVFVDNKISFICKNNEDVHSSCYTNLRFSNINPEIRETYNTAILQSINILDGISNEVNLFMKKDFTLAFSLDIGTIGKMCVLLSPLPPHLQR